METHALTPSACKVIAHRGASGYAPENTLASFRKGLEMGAEMLELDIHLSRDGEIVVIHDHSLDKTTTGSGYVKDHTVKELKQFDAGKRFDAYRGERIPLLQEVFDLVQKRAALAIEIKNCPILYPDIERKLVRLIEKNDLVAQVIVIAFYHPSLKVIKQSNPAIRTGILYVGGLVEPWAAAATVEADALHPHYEYVLPEMVAAAHQRGYLVHPWTVNKPAEMAQQISYGVDGITTNYPDLLVKSVRNV